MSQSPEISSALSILSDMEDLLHRVRDAGWALAFIAETIDDKRSNAVDVLATLITDTGSELEEHRKTLREIVRGQP